MKPQEQTRKTPNGDCLRACVATLLEVPISKVPDFVESPEVPGSPFPAYWLSLQGWLNERGLWFLEVPLPKNMPWMPLPFPALCIFFGETKTGVKHAVIGRVVNDGFEAIFNPWPEAEFGEGVAGLGFILPADPATFMRLGIGLARVERLAQPYAHEQPGSAPHGAAGIMLASVHQTAQESLGTATSPIFKPNGERA